MVKQHKFERFEKLIGSSNLKTLSKKSVLILGCGGVGGYACEALARSNIGTLILVDYDVVDITNINRQVIALNSTIGRKKVDALEERINDINSNCKVIKIDKFIDSNNLDILFQNKIDFFVDACDTISTKKEILKKCLDKKIDFISSMGTGNKLDPSKLEIVDIRKTINDPLARILRRFIKDEKINKKIMVLSSRELPMKTKDRIPGSTAFVPSSAGLLIASYVVRWLLNNKEKKD
ncbi:MAG: tRNA threonylcarbamoyladenosine dehydratase [Bacilli bacterium]|nr:tRNA threonylcarbamoyladenosine dehydratase [Bacilli bacterium]